MNNTLKDFQEEQDMKLDAPCVSPELKSYIHSREEALLKRIGEEVEEMNGLNVPGIKLLDLNNEEYIKKSDIKNLLV